jgi:hypothetical protein
VRYARIAGGNHRNCKNRRSRYFIVFYMCYFFFVFGEDTHVYFLTSYLLCTYSSTMESFILSCMYFSNLKKAAKTRSNHFPNPARTIPAFALRFSPDFFSLNHIHPREFPRFHSLRTYVESTRLTIPIPAVFFFYLQLASFHSNFPRFAQFHNF